MRDFLNQILAFIVAESMTDVEFLTVESTLMIYDQGTYDDLTRILKSRYAVSTYQDRLNAFYTAKGVVYETAKVGSSNIFIGEAL